MLQGSWNQQLACGGCIDNANDYKLKFTSCCIRHCGKGCGANFKCKTLKFNLNFV